MISFERKICVIAGTRTTGTGALTNQATVTRFPTRKQISLSFKFHSRTLVILFFLRATHKWVFQFGFTYILTSHLVLGLYFTLILKIFISDGHIDDNFLDKNLCHSRDSNHRSPVFRTGALTTQATVTRFPTGKQISLSF